MTAAARRDPEPHPLVLGATPAVIRQRLLPDDAARFVAAQEATLDDARASLDLAGAHEVVERWRGMAILQTDPAAYRRTIRRAAELGTGEASPDDEPLEITTSKAGLQPMYGVETVGDDIDASIAALPAELLEPSARPPGQRAFSGSNTLRAASSKRPP